MKKILSIAVALVLLIGLIPIAGMMNATAADTWTLVTDASTLQAGDQIVIASNAKGFVAGAYTPADNPYLANSGTTAFSSDKSTITSLADNAMVFTLGGTTGSWTLTNGDGQLLGSTAVKKMALDTGVTTWTIAIDSSTNATISSTTSTYGRILHNVNSTRFTTYTSNTSTSMLLPQIYRLVKGGDTDISDNTSTSTSASTAETTTTTTAPSIDGIVFDLGANGAATHNDGSVFTAAKEFTSTDGANTLTITPTANTYSGARDALGNSCLKLGTSGKVGSFRLTVEDDVTAVVFYVAQYKANTTKISINGGDAQTVSTASDKGEYTAFSVDTTSEKTVTFTTVSGGYRCMINTIALLTGGATVATTTTTAAPIYKTPAEIMNAASALASGATLSDGYTYTLSGVITNVNTAYDSEYQNVTVTMLVDGTDKSIQCFRMKGDGADLIGTGDQITVSGVIKNFNGTIEFDSGCSLLAYELSGQEVTIYEGAEAIMNAAYELASGATLSDGHAYTLSGVITNVDYAYDESRGNASVTMTVTGTEKTIYCYKLAGEGADIVGVGDTITVTGPIKNYNGKIEFDGCTLDSYKLAAAETPTFIGRDVTLRDDLDVGFYVGIPEEYDPTNLSVVFTVNGVTTTVALESNDEDAYIIHLSVPAKEMRTGINARLVDGSGTELANLDTTIYEYAKTILDDTEGIYTAAEKTAAKAMLNYGAKAQAYFKYGIDDGLANEGYEFTQAELDAADVSDVAALSINGDRDNYLGASLVLKSQTAVRLYFNEQVAGARQNANGWYIELTGIGAGSLGTTQTVTVGKTTYSFSALSFAKTVIEGEYDTNFQNLMKALVLYADAAAALQ